jgi:hypothetical protein
VSAAARASLVGAPLLPGVAMLGRDGGPESPRRPVEERPALEAACGGAVPRTGSAG